mmetsp:Transcript_2420/g.5910  ORF Transcript_2420/g.5910 Transcript_2420/m.5910 type:complete len:255 (+) Transcript_2420:1050-1814(+)
MARLIRADARLGAPLLVTVGYAVQAQARAAPHARAERRSAAQAHGHAGRLLRRAAGCPLAAQRARGRGGARHGVPAVACHHDARGCARCTAAAARVLPAVRLPQADQDERDGRAAADVRLHRAARDASDAAAGRAGALRLLGGPAPRPAADDRAGRRGAHQLPRLPRPDERGAALPGAAGAGAHARAGAKGDERHGRRDRGGIVGERVRARGGRGAEALPGQRACALTPLRRHRLAQVVAAQGRAGRRERVGGG